MITALHAQPSPGNTAGIEINAARTDRNLYRNDVQAVIGMAGDSHAVPPEFAADALITLVEAGLIPDRRMQRDVLEEAFALAANAQEKIALKRGAGDSPVTSALHGAFRNGIDRVSLRSRVVHAMLPIDTPAARALFQRIDLPIGVPSPVRKGEAADPDQDGDCDRQTVPDFTLYYLTMFDVSRTIPDHAQLETFFAAHLPRLTSAAQITPLARVFMQVRDIEHMPAVINAFAGRLPDLMQDRRVFSSYFEETIEAIGQLVTSAAPSSRERLIQQSREWVMRSVDHGVCAQSSKYSVAFDGSRKPITSIDPAAQFNREVAWRSRNSDARMEGRAESPATSSRHADVAPNSSEYTRHFQTHLLLSRDDDGALDLVSWRNEMERYITRLSEWTWPSAQIVSNIVSYYEPGPSEPRLEGAFQNVVEARQDGVLCPADPRPPVSGCSKQQQQRNGAGINDPRSQPLPVDAVIPSDASISHQPELAEQTILPAAFEAAPIGVVGRAVPSAPIDLTPRVANPIAPSPAAFYLEKSDLLSQVLFIERHAPVASTGRVRINWEGVRRQEGPRVQIPSRDRVLSALVDLFDSETARKVYAERRVLWFSPVRDLLGAYDRSGDNRSGDIFAIAERYASSNHPVLSLYGRLARLLASR